MSRLSLILTMKSDGLIVLWVFDLALLGVLLLFFPRLGLRLGSFFHNSNFVLVHAHILLVAWLIFTIALFVVTVRSFR